MQSIVLPLPSSIAFKSNLALPTSVPFAFAFNYHACRERLNNYYYRHPDAIRADLRSLLDSTLRYNGLSHDLSAKARRLVSKVGHWLGCFLLLLSFLFCV